MRRERAATRRLPSAPAATRVARGAVAGIETALEADLHEDARALDLVGHGVERLEVERDGLLAEGRQARARREPQERRVRRRRRRDHERVDAGLDERLRARDGAGPSSAASCVRAGLVGVAQRQRADAGRALASVRAWNAPMRPTPISPTWRGSRRAAARGSSTSKRLQ